MIKTTTLLQITGTVFLYTAFTVGTVAAMQPLGIGAGLIILLGHLGLLK